MSIASTFDAMSVSIHWIKIGINPLKKLRGLSMYFNIKIFSIHGPESRNKSKLKNKVYF